MLGQLADGQVLSALLCFGSLLRFLAWRVSSSIRQTISFMPHLFDRRAGGERQASKGLV